jgi:hypothetical protein
MMNLDEFKKFLGPQLASMYTDEEIIRLEWEMRTLAEILLNYYVQRKQQDKQRKTKQPTESVDGEKTTT